MSEPITLTERERAVFSHVARTLGKGRIADDVIVSNAILHFLDMDFRVRTESASPPRAPVTPEEIGDASKAKWQRKHGDESGSGQPTDIVERLERIRSMIGKMCREGRPPAMTVPADPTRDEDLFIADAADEAAAEIRRLRGEIAAMNSLVDRTFDDLGVLREQVKTERRAGIEAAAKWHAKQREEWGARVDSPAGTRADIHRICEEAIRALADKPAPDARKGG